MTDIVIVKVKPGSRKGPLVEIGSNGELTIYVREPAVDGKANDAVARLLAAHLQFREAESNWFPERRRAKSVSVSAAAAASRLASRCDLGVIRKAVFGDTPPSRGSSSSTDPIAPSAEPRVRRARLWRRRD